MSENRLPAFEPPSPGEMLKDDILPGLQVSPAEAARRMGVSRQALHAVLSGRAGLSPDMAVRISRLVGSTPNHWLAMQAAHDLWFVERDHAQEFSKIEALV